ncbi:MAG: rhamnogalacturonan acetylesterase [Lentisphaeria bacterium]|nr:rhamnogalacturonan acetylesterase [Lentisphaeria bacterium]
MLPKIAMLLGALSLAGVHAGEITRSASASDLPEGNYKVTLRFGDANRETVSCVKAEGRRLMLDRVATKPGEFVTKSFTVNIRTPEIGDGGKVSLKKGENGHPRWDGKLQLEVFSDAPEVPKPQIAPDPGALTVFLAGDSTVTDQGSEPWASWGLMLPAFFEAGTAVANHAESGLALNSFVRQKRLGKIISQMKKGDYVFIQFGHNDQKEKGENAGPFKSYKTRLAEFVDQVAARGGNPVLVTPMERRRFRKGKPITTLHDYAEAVRQVGKEKNIPVIDLHAMSLKLYGALGDEGSRKAFVFYPAGSFPGQSKELKDNTHHSVYGGYELARCVVEGIRAGLPELAARLRPEIPAFDPAAPDQSVDIPPSTVSSAEKPDGN